MFDGYFHSIRKNTKTLESILSSGAILSREKAKVIRNYEGFNGHKWISLCKYSKQIIDDEEYRFAYPQLIVNGLFIVISEQVNAIKTLFMSYDELYDGLISDDSDIRYSDCLDEYQVKDMISKEFFIAVGYPYRKTFAINHELANYEREIIDYLLRDFHIDIPIIDSSEEIIDTELGHLQKVLKRNY